MKKIITLLVAFLLIINLYNCTEKDDIPTDVEIQNFVWKALNLYYLWQDDTADLKDDRFVNQTELNNFLAGKTPENLFYSLLHQEDRFSWIVDDYIALENLFAGVTLNNGMEYGLKIIDTDVEQIFGYVRYVIPNSDADNKGVVRGQIIYGINGSQLTRSNYKDLLSNETYTVDFGTYTEINEIPVITANNQHISLTKEDITENPVHTITINQVDDKKIGYLLYNQFTNEFDNDLNNAFATFQSENITDLVLDFRYNGGGSVATAVYLASMITGQFTGDLFSTLSYNEKLNGELGIQNLNFQSNLGNGQALNHLNLDEVTILVTGSTASASELIINGLMPYINVKIVGTQTVGKSVASVTLYDSPNYRRENVNPNHTYALQPIVSELKNKLGENNHIGFIPTPLTPENFADLGILGDVNETLFAKAIEDITANRMAANNTISLKSISNSKTHNAQNNMFIEL